MLEGWVNSKVSFWTFLARDYTNNPSYNLYFHNILTGLVLPERTFLPGLFLGTLMFLNFFEYHKTWRIRYLIFNGIILGSLPFWHTHTFIFFLITSLIFGFWFCFKINFKKTLIEFLIMFFIALIMAMPFLILFFSNHSLSNFVRTSFGWQNGAENILLFWFKNSLFVIPLAIGGFWLVKNEDRIFFVPALIIFVISNLFIFQPWEWDNIKLLSWSFLFFAMLTGSLLAKIYKINFFAKFIVTITILISTLSGILSLGLQLKNTYVLYDNWDMELANWARTNTKVDEIFLIDPVPNHPIPGLAGRLVYVGYPGHLWVHGIDYYKRENLSRNIVRGNLDLIADAELPISYVVMAKSNSSNRDTNYRLVFENNKYLVFDATLKI